MIDRRTLLQSAVGGLGAIAAQLSGFIAPTSTRPGQPTFTAPVVVLRWRYDLRVWSPEAWATLPEADQPDGAYQLNAEGWWMHWASVGPTESLVEHWRGTAIDFAAMRAENPALAHCYPARICLETGGWFRDDGSAIRDPEDDVLEGPLLSRRSIADRRRW